MPKAKRKREAPAPPNVTVEPAPKALTLARKSTTYTFRPNGEFVDIEFKSVREHRNYVVPIYEARDLWRKLTEEGYERF